jgi:hypothetical protein
MPTPRHIHSAQTLKAPRIIWECGGLPPFFCDAKHVAAEEDRATVA